MKTFKIELTTSEINTIVNALADKPYKEVMNLIPKIVQQTATPEKEEEAETVESDPE